MPDPVDFIDVAGLFSDEERLVRDTVRAYVRDRILPNIAQWFEEGTLPRELGARARAARTARHAPRGLRLRGSERGRLWHRLFGTRSRRFRGSQLRVGSGIARDVCDPSLGRRGAEADVACADGARRADRLFRPDRARLWQQSGRHANLRPQGRIRLGHRRDKDVDHKRIDRRSCHRLGANRCGHSRLHRSARRARLFGNEHRAKAVAARIGYERARPRRVPPSGRRAAAARGRLGRAALLFERSALRHRVGSDRRGAKLLRIGARVQQDAHCRSIGPSAAFK